MPFWKSSRPGPDRMTPEQLASFGRFSFLGEAQSGVSAQGSFALVSDLASLTWGGDPSGRATVIAELRRHAPAGEWQKVGAWKFVREFLDDAPDTGDLIDGGLSAIIRMRVTNLAIHLAPVDMPRYEALAGGPPPNDGFFGPPVFDSRFGPARQYYLDLAAAVAANRSVTRVPGAPGVAPGPVTDAARAMWDFGQLIYRGPDVVNPDIAFEPSVVRPAIATASGVDHAIFMDRVADVVLDPGNHLSDGLAPIGGARFAEDYLGPEAQSARGYRRLLDAGISYLARSGEPGLMVAPGVLTPVQRERLSAARSAR